MSTQPATTDSTTTANSFALRFMDGILLGQKSWTEETRLSSEYSRAIAVDTVNTYSTLPVYGMVVPQAVKSTGDATGGAGPHSASDQLERVQWEQEN